MCGLAVPADAPRFYDIRTYCDACGRESAKTGNALYLPDSVIDAVHQYYVSEKHRLSRHLGWNPQRKPMTVYT
jgi:hypothetical protein